MEPEELLQSLLEANPAPSERQLESLCAEHPELSELLRAAVRERQAPIATPSAEEVLDEYLSRLERDEEVDLEHLCKLHPKIEPRLRQLADGWKRFSDQLQRLEDGQSLGPDALASHPGYQKELEELLSIWPDFGSLARQYTLSHASEISEVSSPRSDSGSMTHSALGITERAIVGEYRLGHLLGRGGMGEVWQARQASLSRDVALKLILPERVSEKGLAMFAREARASGRLSHPCIVSVYGAGQDSGLHWIAMELVPGAHDLKDRLSALRDEEDLPRDYFKRTAEFMVRLAEALEHAHAAGVIHRDVKPQNILIGPDDQPKLTDFGLARISDESKLSRTGDFAGTYYYMSPEQVTAKRMGIDHRTDIFSLGAVMYEMLSLKRPFEGDTTHQVAEKILYYDPPDLLSIRSRVPFDLAVICGKAMEKRRQMRYASAEEMAADLRRYLNNESILARPPSFIQRTSNWIRRNPTRATALLVVGLAMLVISGLLGAYKNKSDQLGVANRDLTARGQELEQSRSELAEESRTLAEANENLSRERENLEQKSGQLEVANRNLMARGQELEQSRSELAEESRTLAEANENLSRERENLERISDFQASTLSKLEPEAVGEVILEGFVERYAKTLEQDASLSEEQREESLALLRGQLAGIGPTNVAIDVFSEELLARHQEAIDAEFGDDPATQGRLIRHLGEAYLWIGLMDEAEENCLRAVELLSSSLPEAHPQRLQARFNLANCRVQARDLEGAEEALQVLLSEAESGGAQEHLITLNGMGLLSVIHYHRGDLEVALESNRKTLEVQRRVLGEKAEAVLDTMLLLGAIYYQMSRFDEAVALTRQALEGLQETVGPDNHNALTAGGNLSVMLSKTGRYDEAADVAKTTMEGTLRIFGDRSPHSQLARNNLALAYDNAGRIDEATAMYQLALDGWRAAVGESDPRTLITQANLAKIFSVQGQHERALELLAGAFETQRDNLGPDHDDTLRAQLNLGNGLWRADRFVEAEQLQRDLLQRVIERHGPQHSLAGYAGRNLSRALESLGRKEEALDKLRSAHETMLAAHGRHHPDTLSMWVDLVDALSTADLEKEAIGKAQAMGQALLESETLGDTLRTTLVEYLVTFYSTLDEAHPDAGHDVQADQWRSHLAPKSEADPGDTTSVDDGE